MKLTKVEQQALRLSVTLAQAGGQAGLSDLATREGMSPTLVAKILGKLREAGVVRAVRGRRGGYELAAAPADVTAAVVLRSLGRRRLVQGCAGDEDDGCAAACPHDADCGLRAVVSHLERRVADVLERVTLADLARDEGHVKRTLDGGAGAETSREAAAAAQGDAR